MGAKIINFPLDKKLPANKPLYNFSYSSTENVADMVIYLPAKKHRDYERAWLNEKHAEEMFPEEYFMLVE